MCEILLALNIVWALALAYGGLAIGCASIVVVLALIASRDGVAAWRRGGVAAWPASGGPCRAGRRDRGPR